LDHPKIGKILQIYETFDLFIIIFDCDYKLTIDTYVQKRPMWEEELKEFALKMLYTLKYIHSHRLALVSIRPEYIAYDPFARDFAIISVPYICRQTREGKNQKITPGYVAPETLNEAKIKPESDIFSLGALLFKWYQNINYD